ncbi:uncharacterized protein LOC111323555 [Stylophora pistillata]|uniref:uncharacterized protein LOC111323555 n=1 Tax=Stylophora pistillata TaxID=50429 RepID=UPI000C044EF0|nr:uncharacterized protein LOC111323555 [Stylophora pistillata]
MSDRDRSSANPGRTELEQVHTKRVEIKDVTVTVKVRNEIHAHTNHYIKQSKPYFPNEKLRTYIDCPYFLRIARWLCGASLFGALVAAGASKAIPAFFLVSCLLFFLFYCQHEWVNQKTLPIVHKQPFLNSQAGRNKFYEVTVTELDGIALQNYQAGIGFVKLSQGKIKFQAFNETAMKRMFEARCQSRLMLLLFLAASVYNCYFVAAY